MPNAFKQRAKREHHHQRRDIFPAAKTARSPSASDRLINSAAGTRLSDAHVVVRAGMHAIQAKRAVHVTDLERLKERQLAAALQHHKIRRRQACVAAAANAVLGLAVNANILVAHAGLPAEKRWRPQS